MWLESIETQQRVYDYYVHEAECQWPRFLPGIVRGIIEIGQVRLERRARSDTNGRDSTAEDELDEICSDEIVYFSGKPSGRLRSRFVLIIEFPDIIVDPEKFISGKGNPRPLRLPNCGIDYSIDGEPTTVRHPLIADTRRIDTPNGRKSTLSERCILYKMLMNKGFVKPDKRIVIPQLGKLLDEWFLFEIQLKHDKRGNVNHKIFYQDPVKIDVQSKEKNSFYIGFNKGNDIDALRSLDSHIINTIKLSDQYSGSMIEKQIVELEYAK